MARGVLNSYPDIDALMEREADVQRRGRLMTEKGMLNLWGQPSFYDQYGPGATPEQLKKAATEIAFGAMTAGAGGSSMAKALQKTNALKRLGIKPGTQYSAPQVQQGKLAWHGSPHKFDKFADEAIGTGEGAQAYGYGHYFADRPGTAEYYKQLGTQNKPIAVFDHPAYPGKHVVMRGEEVLSQHKTAEAARKALSKLPEPQSHLYQTALKAQDDVLLHWDKPLSEQPKAVQEIAKNFNIKTTASGMKEARGSDIYQMISSAKAKPPFDNASMNAGGVGGSDALRKAGIKGIKYLDGGSRGAGQGTYNYVVFDPKDTAILKTMGIGGVGILGSESE